MIESSPIRACYVCEHSAKHLAGEMRCFALAVCGARVAQSVGVSCRDARSLSGPCGPEARFLEIIEIIIERKPKP